MKSSARKHKPSANTHLNRKGVFLKKGGQQDTAVANKQAGDSFIQSSLNIGTKNDQHEAEADEVADQVVAHSEQPVRTPLPGSGENTSSFFSGNNIHRKSFFEPEPDMEQVEAPQAVQSKPDPQPDHQTTTGINNHASPSGALANQTPTSDATEEIQQKETEETEDKEQDKDRDFESRLNESKGKGSSLPSDVQSSMETSMGADFSGVRVHTDQRAGEMSESINAQAFTHENNIYFNEGKYSPSTTTGKHLLAHELTHTIQQGASVQRKAGLSRVKSGKIQRSWLGDAASAVGGAISSAAEFVGDSLEAGKDWLLGKFKGLIADVPGYELFTVVIGRDPIRDRTVERNGRNFIEAGLDIIPNGADYKQKLQREGALGEAAQWLDEQIAQMDIDPQAIMQQFNNWWDDLSLSDIGKPREKLNELLRIFSAPMNRIIRFAKNVASKLLEIVKNYVLSKVVDFIKNRTTAYPLATVILGEDPITKEQVDRSGMNILKGFINLHPQGEEQLRQMKESGTLQRAANWIDRSVKRVYKALTGIGTAFKRTWDKVSIESLLNPIDTFREIYGYFEQPVSEIFSFLWEVGSKILEFIKNALLRRLSSWAEGTRGYPLIKVLLGRDPFTWENVERTPMKLIRGFFSLMEGGIEKFNQLKESGAVQRLISWIEGAVANLNITWSYIRGLFVNLWNTFSLTDLANPIGAFRRIINTFSEPIRRILAFIFEVIKAVVRFALEVMNFPFKTIQNIVNNAMQAYEDIKADPVQFFLNLLGAVKLGFEQFFDNFVSHLLNGIRDWLFGQLSNAGIEPPADLSFRSVLGMVMDVLGITVENIWNRLAEKIGQDKVDRIRSAIDRLTGIWTFIKDVMERGPIAIWEKIQEKLSDLWGMVVEQVRNWVVTKIIEKVTTKLLSMLDPTGIMAVVNGFIAFYRAVQSFVEKLREMLEIVNSFVAGVANIAKGEISQAANFLENALARGIPVAIGFLANQVGLGNLGKKISEMIESLREKVNSAIDWLIDKALRVGRGIVDRLMGRDTVDEPSSGTDEQSREQNKQSAISIVRRRIAGGIRRSQLVALLQELKQRYALRRAQLNSSDDVIVENSDPEIIPARPITVNRTDATPPGEDAESNTTASGNVVRVGTFSGTKDAGVSTIWGVLRSTPFTPPTWPFGADVTTADRPRTVEATLFGYPGENLEPQTRDNDTTRIVGHFGNYESGLRGGIKSWRPNYDGGHILGHQFGGGETYDNLVPQQNNELNRGLYARMETFIRNSLPERNASQIANPGETRLHISARMNYSPMVSRTLYDIAKVAASPLRSDTPAFYNAMNEDIRNERRTVPYRTPSSMTVEVELSADMNPASLETVEGTSSRTSASRTRATSSVEVNDPILVSESASSQEQQEAPSTTGTSENNRQAERRNWSATFTFTQGNQA